MTLAFSKELSDKQFNKKRVKVASLFIDSGTSEAFANAPLARAARVKGDSEALKTEADLVNLLEASKGLTLVLLAHVEGSDYVVRTSSKQEQFRMPIKTVRSLARQNNVSLIDIGCETTKAITEESFGFGVMTRYNSIEAVMSVEKALSDAKTHQDFLVSMSSEGLKIVVDPTYFENQLPTSRATVYSKVKDVTQNLWVKVAQVSTTEMPASWYVKTGRAMADFWDSVWK